MDLALITYNGSCAIKPNPTKPEPSRLDNQSSAKMTRRHVKEYCVHKACSCYCQKKKKESCSNN